MQYRFIKPQQLKPRQPRIFIGDEASSAIDKLVTATPEVVHYDLETTGLNYVDPKQVVTTIGIATPDWVVGIDLMDVPMSKQQELWDWLGKQKLAGFNLGFDIAWPWRRPLADGRVEQDIQNLDIVADTALWFRLLATESYIGQSHSVEALASTVLGWPERFQQKNWLRQALETHGLRKDEMWHLAVKEPYRYTEYCALDAEASYQAMQVFDTTVKEMGFEGLYRYHDMVLVPKIKRQIRAASCGIKVDRDTLHRNIDWVRRRMIVLEAQILSHPKMVGAMEEYTQRKLNEAHVLKINQKRVWAKSSDKPWERPDIYRLQLSANVDKLARWQREFGGKFYKSETQFTITKPNKEWPRFNMNSDKELKWLIYDYWLEETYDVWYRNPKKPKAGGLVTVEVDGKKRQVDLTKAGGLPVGGEILTIFGEVGNMINEYRKLDKLLGDFLTKFEMASRRTGYIHAQSKILGTVTGRGAGGNSE